MQKTAIVCVTNDLTTDQRVNKTCLTLQKCGYRVVEYGRLLPQSMPLERPYFILRKKLWFRTGPQFYIEYNIRLFLHLLFAEIDLIFSNDLDTLPAVWLASKIRHKKLIYDMHELFTEAPELINRPFVKWIWQKTEDFLLPKTTTRITVCQSISDFYKTNYNVNVNIVRNIPILRTKRDDKLISFPGKKIILYQGAINIGRGLEWVIDAMPFINDAILVIIGNGDIKNELEDKTKKAGLEHKVVFLGLKSSDVLHEYTSSADIGLCLLEEKGLNYYYSLPNRIFDYIHAGVPVLATRFPEITNIVERYKTGVLIDHYEPEFLAETINEMLKTPVNTEHFETLSKELCWENEEKVLIEVINELQNN